MGFFWLYPEVKAFGVRIEGPCLYLNHKRMVRIIGLIGDAPIMEIVSVMWRCQSRVQSYMLVVLTKLGS